MSDLCICIFEVYVFYDFLHDILKQRTEDKRKIMAVLGSMVILIYGLNYLNVSLVNLFGVILIYLIGTILLFCSDLKTCILYYLIFYIVMTGMEFVAGIFYTVVYGTDFPTEENNPFGNLLLIVITKILSYVILRTIKLFVNRGNIGTRGKFLKMAFLLPLTTMLLYAGLLYANIQVEHGKIILSLGCILLLFSNVLVFYIIEKLALVMNQNREYELMEMQNSLNKAYYGKLEEVGMQHKRYAHDLKEYLQTIGGLAVKCQSDEIVNILKDMEIEIDNIPDKIYTNNSTLNALLCEKELQAQKKDIDIHIMVEPELKLEHIKNGDLIVMTGNLLDNAIEAAEQCKEDRKIDLKFYEANENFIVLDIENTYENTIKKIGEQYISTKKDNKNHGIGIKSVREIAGQYGGTLYMEQKDGNFISILTLSKMYNK
jgi:hypothetical protein